MYVVRVAGYTIDLPLDTLIRSKHEFEREVNNILSEVADELDFGEYSGLSEEDKLLIVSQAVAGSDATPFLHDDNAFLQSIRKQIEVL